MTPPRQQARNQRSPKPGNQFDSSFGGSNENADFERRIRELQAGKASKFAPYVAEDSGRRVEYPKEEKIERPPSPQGGGYDKQNFSQNQNYLAPREKYHSPPRDEQRSSQSYKHPESSSSQNYDRDYSQDNYGDQKELHRKGKRSPNVRHKRSSSPHSSSQRGRKRSQTPPPKQRKKSFSPRQKSKYESRSRSPTSKRQKESSKKGRSTDHTDESERKKSPPRSSRLGPGIDSSLIVIPRRKDEGTTPIFDRPEIPIYTIRDDPSLIAEGYFDKEDSQRARSPEVTRASEYQQKAPPVGEQRAPSPTVTFRSTGLEKYNFPNSAAFFERRKEPQIVSTTLGEIHDRMRESMQASALSHQVEQLPSSDLRLALDRKQLSPMRGSFQSDLLNQERMIYESEKMAMNRSLSEERRPVKERLGGKKENLDMEDLPDFRKEVDYLNQLSTAKGRGYFHHDDREDSPPRDDFSSSRGLRRPLRGFRGRGYVRGRGFLRGGFSTRGRYIRGRYVPAYRTFGRGSIRESRDRWTHDKFEDEEKTDHKKKESKKKSERSSKKEKKSKKPDTERRSSTHK